MDLATVEKTQITRPLRVLVPLIKEDLKQAEEAVRSAGMPYYKAAGDKMLEAKSQMPHGDFKPWLARNFTLSYSRAKQYMQFASAMRGKRTEVQSFSSLNDFHRQTGSSHYRSVTSKRDWHEPVKEAIGRVNVEALMQGAKAQQEERALQRKLSLSLIDIGYKALASKLHPDKGGSAAAMTRLNRVREILKKAVTA